jgi:hypothetical protein
MKDRIGNTLTLRDKVLVELPTSSIVGFISDLKECGLVAIHRGQEAVGTPGHVLVSCVIAIPINPSDNAAAALVKVYDADRPQGPSLIPQGGVGSSREN